MIIRSNRRYLHEGHAGLLRARLSILFRGFDQLLVLQNYTLVKTGRVAIMNYDYLRHSYIDDYEAGIGQQPWGR
jgi:hypothetical protein